MTASNKLARTATKVQSAPVSVFDAPVDYSTCKKPSIQFLIIEFLCRHEEMTYNGQTFKKGLSYDEVLERVLQEVKQAPFFDESKVKTTKKCVQWYASKIHNENTQYFDSRSVGIMR